MTFTLRARGGTILALTTKHELVTDKTLLAKAKNCAKKRLPAFKAPTASFFRAIPRVEGGCTSA